MSQLSDQFSEARKFQVEAQFEFIRNFTGRAFESVEKIIALNFDASRASLEKSSEAMRRIVAAKDPRDLLALNGAPQAQIDSVLAYSRQLFDIAASVPPLFAPVPAPAPATAAPKVSAAPAPAPVAAAEPVPAAAREEPPAGKAMAAAKPAAPIAKSKPVAKPAAKLAAKPEPLPHPSAASFPAPSAAKQVAVAHVKPVDAAPPHAPVSGTPEVVAKKAAEAAAKPARKK